MRQPAGSTNADSISGGDDNDFLYGQGSNDSIDGGVGGANFVTIATLNNVTASLLSFAVGGNVLI